MADDLEHEQQLQNDAEDFHAEEAAEVTLTPAQQRLRAFEDEHLGVDTPRIAGLIERGSGSHFQTKLDDKRRAHYAALERLVEYERRLDAARATVAVAESDFTAAKETVALFETEADAPTAE